MTEQTNPSDSAPPQPPPPAPPAPLSPADERTWAMLAHLSMFLNAVSGFLGVVGALVIYLVYKERSRYVAYQAMQSFVFQLIAWVGGGLLAAMAWIPSALLSPLGIGCVCMPFAVLLTLVPLAAPIYSIVAALECNQGKDFKYGLIGDWVRGTLSQ